MSENESKETLTFESAMERLESIVETLEQGESTLDESIDLYQEGMKLSQFCSDTIEKAELRVERVREETDQPTPE